MADPTYPTHATTTPTSARGAARTRTSPKTAQATITTGNTTGPAATTTTAPPDTPEAASPGTPEAGPRKKRANTSKKGAAVELMAIKLLEAAGYKVHRCIRTGAKRGPLWISQSNDVFGCIDLVAKKLGERTRWIQVTADSGIGRKRKEMDDVPWDPQFDSVEIWRWVGGAARKHKTTGTWLERQYFQVYHFDEHYELLPARRIPVEPGNDTLSHGAVAPTIVEA